MSHYAKSFSKTRIVFSVKCKYRLHHDVEVSMGFTQSRAKGPRIVYIPY